MSSLSYFPIINNGTSTGSRSRSGSVENVATRSGMLTKLLNMKVTTKPLTLHDCTLLKDRDFLVGPEDIPETGKEVESHKNVQTRSTDTSLIYQ